MTGNEILGRDLSAWLHEEGEHRVPDHLASVLERTAATRQRPWWSSPERWLPMHATARFAPAVPRLGWVVVVVALVLALIVGLALFAGVGRTPLPAPFGPARNGDFVFSADGEILRFDSATGVQVPIVTGPAWDFGATFSRDGTRLLFGRVASDPAANSDVEPAIAVAVANADGRNVRELTPPIDGNCSSDWSPDGRHVVFSTHRPDGYGLLNVLDIEIGTVRTIDPGMSVRCGPIAFRPPDGTEIVFRGDAGSTHAVYAIRPDGTGLRAVNTEQPTCDCDTGGVSPDGRYLAVDRWDDQGFVRLGLLDLTTGRERELPMPDGQFSRGGTFSPDGKLVAFPRLHRSGQDQNTYQIAVAPVDGSSLGRALGPEIALPANGSDEAFVSITFAPDGLSVVASYPDLPTSTSSTVWLLPIDGTPGRNVGRGTFAGLDIQRRAP